ncbi:hypothetical protein R1T16_06230 [Flavobacterium sp. DG1-102-2]|uniref:hypothetical protein n=1 Tax=Flavobacterium sp. DG1-102-2 TaxID=3081663 RepID=UPI0029492987|nr:hypothetical protein [Flavobacterium sp. DG1-102-2]MDV6168014.1 hypothetical protein [Flavobacterium sp. DG1-102-2]
MASKFTLNYSGDKNQLLSKIRNAVGDKGSLSGDTEMGNFKGSTPLGSIEGSYSIDGDTITVNISDKPFLLSTGMIQSEFEKALQKA